MTIEVTIFCRNLAKSKPTNHRWAYMNSGEAPAPPVQLYIETNAKNITGPKISHFT